MTNDLLTEFRSAVSLPDGATARRIYACATSAPRRMPGRRLAAAIAVSLVVAAIALAFSGLFGSPKQSQPPRGHGIPPAYEPLQLTFTRSGQSIASVTVTVQAPISGATMRLQVLRTDPSELLPAMNHVPGSAQVVFQEQAAMTDISPPPTGPGGTVALSTWSGTLSPDDWAGGCQGGLYNISAVVVPDGSSYDNPPDGSQRVSSNWFRCVGG
jgi:hypothetical protein